MKTKLLTMWISLMLLFCITNVNGQTTDFPGTKWKKYATPEEAGYSSKKLEIAKQFFQKSDGAAILLIHDGRVLVSWGETTRRFRNASIRKSYLSALYGIYVQKGKIDLNASLADLNIDDMQGLTHQEKQAKVIDLLTARSGVYHPSAFSPRGMEETLPPRGIHPPGSFWFYQNWDFNTLATIFNQETGKDLFAAFDDQVAKPIQLEDFSIEHTFYRYEPKKSKHPAYLLRMSARDMARFGLLYLNHGNWKGRQIIPEDWVKKSTQPISRELGRFNNRGGYGYLWWVSHGVNGQPMFYASGSGGQRIFIIPQSNLVFVHLVNTYDNNNVGHGDVMKLLELLLQAKISEPTKNPNLIKFEPPVSNTPKFIKVSKTILNKYAGKYRHRFLGEFIIDVVENHLVLTTGIGKFNMRPINNHEFYPEDLETIGSFEQAPDEIKRNTVTSILNENRNVVKAIFYY